MLADVTHDGEKEMLVIEQVPENDENNYYIFSVYKYDMKDGMRKLDYTYQSGEYHAVGFFNCYIKDAGNGYMNLGCESFGMWQGRGMLDFEEYYLDNDGNKITVDKLTLTDNDPSVCEEEGRITEEAFEAYINNLIDMGSEFKVVYAVYSEGDLLDHQWVETDPAKVFAK